MLNRRNSFIGKLGLLVAIIVLVFAVMLSACGASEVDNSLITDEEIAKLYSEPDSFKGRTIEMTGMVLSSETDGDTVYLQVYRDIKNYEENTVVYMKDPGDTFKDDDFVKIVGTVDGKFTGENAFGVELEIPMVAASEITKVDVVDAFPAVASYDVNQTIEKGDYKATVTKVDFTADETRIYLTVENNSGDNFDNYPDQGVIVQNGSQYEEEWNSYYPSPSTELRAGVSYSCIISFKLIDQSDFNYTFSGYNSDYDEIEFSFDIPIK